jgi:hypothetical protein
VRWRSAAAASRSITWKGGTFARDATAYRWADMDRNYFIAGPMNIRRRRRSMF